MASPIAPAPYKLTPLHRLFGAVVEGLDLRDPQAISAATVEAIRQDLLVHRLLLFRHEGATVSAAAQLRVSRWFGEVQSTFYRHPASPHRDVFRVSNDEAEGCQQVGRSGWHIDGSFMDRPFKVQTMTFESASARGATMFSPLRELVESLAAEKRQEWGELSYVAGSNEAALVHPLLCVHPETGDATMCFHCGPGFVNSLVRGYDHSDRGGGGGGGEGEVGEASCKAGEGRDIACAEATTKEVYDFHRTRSVLAELTGFLEAEDRVLRLEWQVGDFALIDNLAVGHYASPETQLPRDEVGLRVLHRTTVGGDTMPVPLDSHGRWGGQGGEEGGGKKT